MSVKTLFTVNDVFKALDNQDDDFDSKYKILEVNFGPSKDEYLK
jgi:hypothetical protein